MANRRKMRTRGVWRYPRIRTGGWWILKCERRRGRKEQGCDLMLLCACVSIQVYWSIVINGLEQEISKEQPWFTRILPVSWNALQKLFSNTVQIHDKKIHVLAILYYHLSSHFVAATVIAPPANVPFQCESRWFPVSWFQPLCTWEPL